MDERQNNTFEMLKKLGNFIDVHKSAFDANSLAIELFNTIKKTIDEVTNLAIIQTSNTSSTKQGVSKKATLRNNLKQDMEAISRTAKGIAIKIPGIDNKFRLPIGNNDGMLLTTAQAFARDVLEFKDEFIRRELSENFFNEFNKNINAFEQATKDKNASRGAQVATTASINRTIAEGIETFKEVDPIVRNKFRNEPNILAEWVAATHIVKSTRSSKRGKAKVTEQTKE